MKRLILASLLVLASCGKSGAPDINISNAWARATAPGQSSAAAYMTISNRGSADDLLVAVTADPPVEAMVHQTSSAGGMTSMGAMKEGLPIPVGGNVELKPLGTHVMISGLPGPLKPGDSLPLTLRFKTSGDRRVDVRVVEPTSADGR